jgi:hypothetical protein
MKKVGLDFYKNFLWEDITLGNERKLATNYTNEY